MDEEMEEENEEEGEEPVEEEGEELVEEEAAEEEEDDEEGLVKEEYLYEVEVIDLDYEFEASRYFDLSREETQFEAQQAEAWFDFAQTYPPSPFAAKLNLGEDAVQENVNTTENPREAEISYPTTSQSDTDMSSDASEPEENFSGLTSHNMAIDVPNANTKCDTKASLTRGSTLMKPTASQLAKQNRREVHASKQFLRRYQKTFLQHNQRGLEYPAIESQAAKRQKLDGGRLRKVADAKPQISFVHKAPKIARPADGNSVHPKLKLTIPREPALETAHRARRMRPENRTALGEGVNSAVSMFKARPLNRKILEAPSLLPPKKSTPRLPEFQEFHLKTSERAMQHSFASSSATQPSNKKPDKATFKTKAGTDSTRPNSQHAPKQEGFEPIHKFKARPLNKKIFSSRGDIGVFRNSKRETTVPMEFNLTTDRRSQYHPPVELFNKLSVTSELRPNTVSQRKSVHPTCLLTKESKENSVNSFQQEKRITRVVKGKPQRFSGNQIQCGVDGEVTEVGSQANMRRSLGIR